MGESFYSDGDYDEDAYSASPYFLFAGAVSFAPALVGAVQKLAGLGSAVVTSYSVVGGTGLQKGFAGAVAFSPDFANSTFLINLGLSGTVVAPFEVQGSLVYEAQFAGEVTFTPVVGVDQSVFWTDESDPSGPWAAISDSSGPWVNTSDPEGAWTNG